MSSDWWVNESSGTVYAPAITGYKSNETWRGLILENSGDPMNESDWSVKSEVFDLDEGGSEWGFDQASGCDFIAIGRVYHSSTTDETNQYDSSDCMGSWSNPENITPEVGSIADPSLLKYGVDRLMVAGRSASNGDTRAYFTTDGGDSWGDQVNVGANDGDIHEGYTDTIFVNDSLAYLYLYDGSSTDTDIERTNLGFIPEGSSGFFNVSSNSNVNNNSLSFLEYDFSGSYDLPQTFNYSFKLSDNYGSIFTSENRTLTVNKTLDTTPPNTQDNWSIDGWAQQSSALVELTATDSGSNVSKISYRTYKVGNSPNSWTTVNPNTTVSIPEPGNWTLEYNATDFFGNTESVNTEYVALDDNEPSASYNPSSTAAGTTTQSWILVNVSYSDDLSGAQTQTVTMDGSNSSFTNCSNGNCWKNFTGLSDGDHTYSAWIIDDAGNVNKTSDRTVTTGSNAPSISTVIYNNWNGGSTEYLNFSLNDPDLDIKNHTTIPAGTVGIFSNSTLKVDNPGSPFDDIMKIGDSGGFFSSPRQVNYTVTTHFAAYTENLTGPINTTHQAVNASKTVDVRGECLQLEVNFSQPTGLKNEEKNGVSTSCVTGQQKVTGHWIVDNVDTANFQHTQNTGKSSNTSTQYLEREKQVSNTWSTDYAQLDVKPPPIDGSCSNCSTRTVNVSGNSERNETFHSSGDWIVNETSYSISKFTQTVSYGEGIEDNFTRRQNISVANNRSSLGLDVDFSPAIPGTDGCSVTNSTVKTVAAATTVNETFFKDCSPGKEDSHSVSKTVLSDSTKYVYEATTTVYTNLTDEVRHKYYIPESRLTEFSSRNDTVSAEVDNSSTGVTWTTETVDSTDYVVVVTYTNHTSSSKHDGQHTETLSYHVEDSSSGGGGGGSGGGGGGFSTIGGSGDTTLPSSSPYDWNVTLIDSDWNDRFVVDTSRGGEFTREIRLSYSGSEELTLDISCVGNRTCEWTSSSAQTVTFAEDGGNSTLVTISGSIPEDVPRDTYTVTYRITDPVYVEDRAAEVGKVDVVVEMEVNSLLGMLSDWISAIFGFFEDFSF